MPKQLVVIAGPDQGLAIPLPEHGEVLLGRSPQTSNALQDRLVSRVHCQVAVRSDEVVVTDAASSDGTYINNVRIVRQRLRPGDIVRIGRTQLQLHSDCASASDFGATAVMKSPGAPAS